MTLPKYDIFKKDGAEALIWVGAATDLESARTRITELSHHGEEFVVFDQHTQEVVATFKPSPTKGNVPMCEAT